MKAADSRQQIVMTKVAPTTATMAQEMSLPSSGAMKPNQMPAEGTLQIYERSAVLYCVALHTCLTTQEALWPVGLLSNDIIVCDPGAHS